MTVTANDHFKIDNRARTSARELLSAARTAIEASAAAIALYDPDDRDCYSQDMLDVALAHGDAGVMAIRAYKIAVHR